MKQLLGLFLLFCFTCVCKAEQPKDTIDNWQIYLGKELLFAGNANIGSLPEVVINKKNATDQGLKLRIVFQHCTQSDTRKEIQIADYAGERLTQYYFDSDKPIAIRVAELTSREKLLLYFYDGVITKPSGIRGVPILKLKFV